MAQENFEGPPRDDTPYFRRLAPAFIAAFEATPPDPDRIADFAAGRGSEVFPYEDGPEAVGAYMGAWWAARGQSDMLALVLALAALPDDRCGAMLWRLKQLCPSDGPVLPRALQLVSEG